MTLGKDTLGKLREDVARKRHLKAALEELYARQQELKPRLQELDGQRRKEQEDVDRLEGRSLAAFIYYALGKKEEKLDKERAEACEAALRYDAAARELAFVEEEIARNEAEQRALEACEAAYDQALAARLAEMKAAGGAHAQAIWKLEEELGCLQSRKKELGEALDAGKRALAAAGRARNELAEADSLATWDLLGGGFLVDLAKHDHLGAAQNQVEQLQVELRRFKTELADVTVQADIRVKLDGFTQFADFIFDGIFADAAVANHISKALGQVEKTGREIEEVLGRLEAMMQETKAEEARLRGELDAAAAEG